MLAADREPWLVIDPKPMTGDPHYELAPMLWNRWEELGAATCATACAAGSTRSSTRAGLDEDRARDWVVVRMVHNAHWAIEDAERRRPAARRRGAGLDHQLHRDRQGVQD